MRVSLIWRVLYYGWLVGEVLILVVTRTRRGGGKVSDRGSLVLLWVVIVAAASLSGWVEGALGENMFGGADWLKTVALAVLVAGLAIRWGAVISLGRAFSANVAIRQTQHLHRTGLFRLVRHPSYLGLMIVFLAAGIRARNWYSLAIILVLPLAALLYRINVEEAALREAFGEEYIAYSGETKRLVPFIY